MSTQKMRKVAWQHVSAIAHPEYYRGDRPCVTAAVVPDEHWTSVERVGDDVYGQYEGLLQLMGDGELIRDVSLCEADVRRSTWREVRTGGSDG